MYDLIIYLLAILSLAAILFRFKKAFDSYKNYSLLKEMNCFKDFVVMSAKEDVEQKLFSAIVLTVSLSIVWLVGAWYL